MESKRPTSLRTGGLAASAYDALSAGPTEVDFLDHGGQVQPTYVEEPGFWPRAMSIPIDYWLLFFGAMIAAGIFAVLVLIPQDEMFEESWTRRLGIWRSVIGFALVAALSAPYRSVDETLDNVLGTFNLSVATALGVCVLFVLTLLLILRGDPAARLRRGSCEVLWRVGRYSLALLCSWFVVWIFETGRIEVGLRATTFFEFLGLGSVIGLYVSGAWCISLHWFGIGQAHPLLPPFVTAATICIGVAVELHDSGPAPLPTGLWLIFNAAAVATTLSLCFVEVCNVVSDRPTPATWPSVVAAVAVIVSLSAAVVLVGTGSADHVLCKDPNRLVKCD